jgi:hypothetical protein
MRNFETKSSQAVFDFDFCLDLTNAWELKSKNTFANGNER